jgi:mannosyltransferase
VVFGLATLPVLYALARRLFGVATAVVAVLWIAANVNFVGHAREARGYSLELLLMTASSFFLVRAVQERRGRDWVWFVLLSGLALYAQLLAGLVILAQFLSLLAVRPRVPLRRVAGAAIAIAVLAVPIVAAVIVHHQGHQLDWVTAPRPRQLPGLFYWFTGSWLLTAIDLVACAIAIWAAYREWRRSRSVAALWPTIFVVAVLVVPPVAAYAVSWAKPVYLYRYFLVTLPALSILVAAGLVRLGRAWIVVIALVATLAISSHTTASCTPGCVIGADDWRAAAAYIHANLKPGDGVVFAPGELRTPLAHFLPPGGRPALLYPSRWPLSGGAAEGATRLRPEVVRRASVRRVWLVTWWLPADGAPQLLGRARTILQDRDFAGNVHVRLYGPVRT